MSKLREALLRMVDKIDEPSVREALLRSVNKPAKTRDGRVLVLRHKPAKNPRDDTFWVEEITSH